MSVIKKRWVFLCVSVVVLLFMGIAYAFSLFVVPIEQDLQFTRCNTSLAFTLCFIFFSLGSLVAGFLLRKIRESLLMRIAAISIGIGFYGATLAQEPWQLYVFYSFFCGLSIGVVYNVSVSIIPLYFQDKTGLATGILLMGFAMSTTIFGPLCEFEISQIGWKRVFIILAISSFTILLISSFIIKKPTEKETQILFSPLKEDNKKIDYTPREVLRSKVYYVFVLVYILIGGVGISLINHTAPTLQEELLLSSSISAWIVSFVCMFNGIGRVLWGYVFDKKGGSLVLLSLGCLVSLGMILIVSSLLFHNTIMFSAGCAISLLCYGGSSSVAPIMIRALFGNTYFSVNFAITNVGTMLLSCVPTIIGMLQVASNGYFVPYILLLVLALLSLVLAIQFKKVQKKKFQN